MLSGGQQVSAVDVRTIPQAQGVSPQFEGTPASLPSKTADTSRTEKHRMVIARLLVRRRKHTHGSLFQRRVVDIVLRWALTVF